MKTKRTAYLLWFFLGWLGIHRFYCRKRVSGVIWLLTLGLFGAGWGIDAILTSKMVDEVKGHPEKQIVSKFQRELRNFGLTAMAIMGFVALLGVGSWIERSLDQRTLQQKTKDAIEAKHRDYRQLKRDFPSMTLDGKVVPVQIEWTSSELTITMPKTYGFGATRFRQQSKAVPRDDFKRLSEEFEGNYFVMVGIEIWSGPSPSFSSYQISIPKTIIPSDFLKDTPSQASVLPNQGMHQIADKLGSR